LTVSSLVFHTNDLTRYGGLFVTCLLGPVLDRDIVGANSLVIDNTSRVIHDPGDGAPGARTVKPSESSAAFSKRRVSNSLFQFIYFKIGSYADAKRQRKSFPARNELVASGRQPPDVIFAG
jgi:hypothetical protein